MGGLDRLIDWIISRLESLAPMFVIMDYQQGIVMRLGNYNRTVTAENGIWGTGWHWQWPLGIEEVLFDSINTVTKNIAVQSLTTLDGIRVNLGMVVTANIEDIKAAFLNVEGAEDAILDAVYGAVGSMVKTETWDDLMEPDWENRITIKSRRAAKRYGWYIQQIQVSDLVRSNSIRLFQN